MTSKERNLQIRNETQINANTALRVGNALEAVRVLNGGESILNTTTPLAVSANTETELNFVGVRELQNNLQLFNTAGKIIPINQGDTLIVGITFSFVIPAGNNNYFSIYFKSNGDIYRGNTYSIVKAQGATEYVSFDAILPVGASFEENGGNLFIFSSVNLQLNNIYKFAQRIFLAP